MLIKLYPKIEHKLFIVQKHHTLSVYQLQAYMISFLRQKPFNLLPQIKVMAKKIHMKNQYIQNGCLLSVPFFAIMMAVKF